MGKQKQKPIAAPATDALFRWFREQSWGPRSLPSGVSDRFSSVAATERVQLIFT
jgi:hypothetical protein